MVSSGAPAGPITCARRAGLAGDERAAGTPAGPSTPGERIQIDTLHVYTRPGYQLKHFSASCPVSRWSVAEIANQATSATAARFLDEGT